MKQKLIVKYIGFIFIIATFMGSMHHHNDMQEHNDCKICSIQHNVVDIDTPVNVNYFTLLIITSEATLVSLEDLQLQKQHLTFSARAPPLFS